MVYWIRVHSLCRSRVPVHTAGPAVFLKIIVGFSYGACKAFPPETRIREKIFPKALEKTLPKTFAVII